MGLINLNPSLIRLITNQLQVGDEKPDCKVEIYKVSHYDSEPHIFEGIGKDIVSIDVSAGVDNLAATCTVVFQNVDMKKIFTKDIKQKLPEPPLKIGGIYITPYKEKVLLRQKTKLEAILVTSRGEINVSEHERTRWTASQGITVSKNGQVTAGSKQGEYIVTATYTHEDGTQYSATAQVFVAEKNFVVYDSILKIRCWDAEDIDRDAIRITLNGQVIISDMELKPLSESSLITLNLKPGLNILKVGARGSGRAYLQARANANYKTDSDWARYKAWLDRGAPEEEGEPYIPTNKLPRSADTGEFGVTSSVELYNSEGDVLFSGVTKNFFLSSDKDPYCQWYVDPDEYFLVWTFINMDVPDPDPIPDVQPDPTYIDHDEPYDHLFEPENKIVVYMGYGEILVPVFTGAIDSVSVDNKARTLTVECRDNMRYLIDQNIDPLRFGLNLTYPRQDIEVQEVQKPLNTTKTVVVIQGTNVNVRTGPGTNYRSIGKVNTGDTFEYLGKKGNWINIKYNGQSAYVYSQYARIEKQSTAPQAQSGYVVRAVTNGSNLNVRSQPSTRSSIIGKLVNRETAPYAGENADGTWYKVIVNGRYGWVSARWSRKEAV